MVKTVGWAALGVAAFLLVDNFTGLSKILRGFVPGA